MRGRAVAPASLIVLAAALVLLTAFTSYIAYATTLKILDSLRNNMKVEVEMRREPKVSITQGLPPGVSPMAYVVIHEASGYIEAIYDIIYSDNRTGNIRHVRPAINLNEGDCVILTPYSLQNYGLPVLHKHYNGSTLVVHTSKGRAIAATRELKPDEIYPCMRLGSNRSQYEILLRVALDGNICAMQACWSLLEPEATPTAYVNDALTVFNVTASPTATINGVNYVFVGWDVYIHPRQVNEPTRFTHNPLPLYVDNAYDVVAVYRSR